MRFKITLNMPTRRGDVYVHQVLCEHPAASVEEFMRQWFDDGYIVVEELYINDDKKLYGNGAVGLTVSLQAKVKELESNLD
jgi:hypothetical protein